MSDETVYAVFEPLEAKLLALLTQQQLLVENPILASALSNIFPYLLLLDHVLEIVTWTNDDPYENFLFVTLFSFLTLYWHVLRLWVLPAVLAVVFLSLVWRTSSIIYDSKFGEKPTVDEVLQTLHNLTSRIEMLFEPARMVKFTPKNYVLLLFATAVVAPVQWVLLRYVLLPQLLLWLFGLFLMTFHSPWCYALRMLVWRSVFVRELVARATGLDIRTSRHQTKTAHHATLSRVHLPASTDVEDEHTLSLPGTDKVQVAQDFVIVRKTAVSGTQLRQTVRFDILENERLWFALGWTKMLLPNERASFCYELLMRPAPDPFSDEGFPFPTFEHDLYKYQWQWMDDRWELDLEFNKAKYTLGWVYYDLKWANPRYEDLFLRSTRARKWTRRAVLLIDKRDVVNDE